MNDTPIETLSGTMYDYKQPFLIGAYVAKLDRKRRIRIPKQLMDSIIVLNGAARKLYLQIDENRIRAYVISAVGKMKHELGQLSLLNKENRKQIEEVGATLQEISITSDDRIMIPNEMLDTLDMQPNSEIKIEGSFEFITICKKAISHPSRKKRVKRGVY